MQHAIGSHHVPAPHPSRNGRAALRPAYGPALADRTRTNHTRQAAPSQNASLTVSQRAGRIATSRGVREIAIVGVAVYLYFFVRGLMHGQEHRAFEHARWLVDLLLGDDSSGMGPAL
jgi:hypothetical protein